MSASTKRALEQKIRELQLRRLRSTQAALSKGNAEVPSKGRIKYNGKVTTSTFDQSLRGVPGNSRNRNTSAVQEIAAEHTGTKTRSEGIGVLRSARNANTTQGSYIRTVVTEQTADHPHKPTWGCCAAKVSDAQGRKEFGR